MTLRVHWSRLLVPLPTLPLWVRVACERDAVRLRLDVRSGRHRSSDSGPIIELCSYLTATRPACLLPTYQGEYCYVCCLGRHAPPEAFLSGGPTFAEVRASWHHGPWSMGVDPGLNRVGNSIRRWSVLSRVFRCVFFPSPIRPPTDYYSCRSCPCLRSTRISRSR